MAAKLAVLLPLISLLVQGCAIKRTSAPKLRLSHLENWLERILAVSDKEAVWKEAQAIQVLLDSVFGLKSAKNAEKLSPNMRVLRRKLRIFLEQRVPSVGKAWRSREEAEKKPPAVVDGLLHSIKIIKQVQRQKLEQVRKVKMTGR